MISKRHLKRLIKREKEIYANKMMKVGLANFVDVAQSDEEEHCESDNCGQDFLTETETLTENKILVSKENLSISKKLMEWNLKHRPSRNCVLDLIKILKEENIIVSPFYKDQCSNKSAIESIAFPQTSNTHHNQHLKNLDEIKVTTNNIQYQMNALQDQMKLVFEVVAENKVLLSKGTRQTHEDESVLEVFPIQTEDKLINLENKINDENKKQYIKTMVTMLEPAGVQKNLRRILSDDIMMAYNVDGVQGKKSLKEHKNFYRILQEAVSMTNANSIGPAEEHIRKALQIQKRRVFKNKSLEKKRKM